MKIEIPIFDTDGVVIQKPNNKGQVTVEFNGKRLRLNQDQVVPIIQDDEGKEPENISLINYNKPESMQIDLRGKRVDEGIESLTQFLDSALVSGLKVVNILHGKGTGSMQNAVQKYLKIQPFISEFNFADSNVGGSGITVVKLK